MIMIRSLIDYLRLAAAYVRFNLKAQLEYRGAFFSQVFSMFVNDGVWVLFWMLFFRKFPILHGWNVADVLTRGELRHDAAPLAMNLGLGGDDVGSHSPGMFGRALVVDERGGRLVTRCLDAEEQH